MVAMGLCGKCVGVNGQGGRKCASAQASLAGSRTFWKPSKIFIVHLATSIFIFMYNNITRFRLRHSNES